MKQFWKHWQFTGSYKIPTPYERLKFYNLIFIILARNELINIYIYIYIYYIFTPTFPIMKELKPLKQHQNEKIFQQE